MSKRKDIATRLSTLVGELDMTLPIGGYMGQGDGKGKPHVVAFSRPRVLDGILHVYSEKFIQVSIQTAYRDLPHRFNAVFESEDNATAFLTHLANHRFDEAMKVPTK